MSTARFICFISGLSALLWTDTAVASEANPSPTPPFAVAKADTPARTKAVRRAPRGNTRPRLFWMCRMTSRKRIVHFSTLNFQEFP